MICHCALIVGYSLVYKRERTGFPQAIPMRAGPISHTSMYFMFFAAHKFNSIQRRVVLGVTLVRFHPGFQTTNDVTDGATFGMPITPTEWGRNTHPVLPLAFQL